MARDAMIVLDGSFGEGGGQMLRTALALSLLTGAAFRIEGIRSGRRDPGLKAQHLYIVKALRQMSDARVEGDVLGATALTFYPGALRGGSYRLDIGTAGSIPLVLQTLLPVVIFAGAAVRWQITGGTDVRGGMTIDFWERVLLPLLPAVSLVTRRHGYYPAGGGKVVLESANGYTVEQWRAGVIEPRGLHIGERGALRKVQVVSRAARALAARRVAERQADAFERRFGEAHLRRDAFSREVVYDDALSPGTSLTAVAEFDQTRIGVDALGERGKLAEAVGEEAAARLESELAAGAVVDSHTADNLMIWTALFGGGYTFPEATGHLVTNQWVIEHFLPGALRIEGNRIVGRRGT